MDAFAHGTVSSSSYVFQRPRPTSSVPSRLGFNPMSSAGTSSRARTLSVPGGTSRKASIPSLSKVRSSSVKSRRHPRVPPRRSPSVMRLHRWRPRRKAKPELTVAPSLLARQKNLDDVRHLPGPRTRPNNGPFTGELPSRFAAFASWIACTVRCAVSRRATPRSPYSPQIGHSVVIIILYVLSLYVAIDSPHMYTIYYNIQ